VQIFGGRGVVHGEIVESLYREIRSLRIYEAAAAMAMRTITGFDTFWIPSRKRDCSLKICIISH
jgi:hypothetical protein